MNREVTRSEVLLSIVVPVFNNSESVHELVDRLRTTLSGVGVQNYEIIFVDDGSGDGSREVLRRLCAVDARVKFLGLTRNFGQQFAITAGLDYSQGEAVLVMDADLQDPPEVIPEFLTKWRSGYDIVYGVRLERAGETWRRRVTAAVFYRILQKLTRTNIALDSGDFRLMSRPVVHNLRRLREQARFIRGMVRWLGYEHAPVYYKRSARLGGNSQYSLAKLFKLALDGIVSFSDVPLRIATWLGFMGVGVCIVYLVIAIAQKLLFGIPVQGWASLVAITIFIGSIQLAVLGVMGQYVGRIFEEVKKRPLYVVQEGVGFQGSEDRIDA